jgi:hypothetical protein
MTTPFRFFVDENGYIADRTDAKNNDLYQMSDGDDVDEHYLRDCLFGARLKKLLSDFIAKNTKIKRRQVDTVFNPLHAVLVGFGGMLLSGSISIYKQKHISNVRPTRRKEFDGTAAAEFVERVELLFKNLYRDLDDRASERLRSAIFEVMRNCTQGLIKSFPDEEKQFFEINA